MTTAGPSPVGSTPNDPNANGVNTGQINSTSSLPTVNLPSGLLPNNTYPQSVTISSNSTTPATSPSTPAQPVDVNAIVAQMAQYETRLRDLQSSRDRTAEEATRAKAELDQLKAKHTEILSGAADAARQALEKASQLEQQLQQERARSLKAEALAAHPELAPYADLIPATVNQDELNQRIAALVAARERDLQTVQQASNTPAPNQRTIIPPANPARPATNSQPQPSTQQMETDLRGAMEKALATGDWTIYQSAMDTAIRNSGLQRNS